MKKLFLIVAALFAVVSFSACSDDDDKDINPNLIIGTWQITLDEGWATFSDGTRDDWSHIYPDVSDGNYYWTYTFEGNGTCTRKSHADYDESDDTAEYLTYSISGNTLTMKGKTDSELDFVGTIKKLTSEQLVLFSSGADADEKFEQTETYKKVK
ncbi:lipocalin-like domain-containing protein [Alistipes onderdonkii]|uniref:lipocalin family protein n=1 Tax=Alistipes onderdonkii TaxID=328813 RepID=UPI001898E16F|nr:lipocalin family protein [Alistipes onderdonkii]